MGPPSPHGCDTAPQGYLRPWSLAQHHFYVVFYHTWLACLLTCWSGATSPTSSSCSQPPLGHPRLSFFTTCLPLQLAGQLHWRGGGQGNGQCTEGEPQPPPAQVSTRSLGWEPRRAFPDLPGRSSEGMARSAVLSGANPIAGGFPQCPCHVFPPGGHISLASAF